MLKIISPPVYVTKTKNTTFLVRTFTCSKLIYNNDQSILSQQIKTNPAHVQLLSPNLHKQVFSPYPERQQELADEYDNRIALSKQHLKLQDIWGKKSDTVQPINIKLPGMYGNNIEEHFMRIGLEQSMSVLEKAERFASIDLPPLPTNTTSFKWQRQAGWVRYDRKTGAATKVDYPTEDALVFDVEVLITEGHYPTMAVAASTEAWYAWTSPYIFTGNEKDKEVLIPMGQNTSERLLVGHNVGYDRARIAEEYNRLGSGIKYIDTMSLHIAVAGLCSQQRPAWNILLKKKQENDNNTEKLSTNLSSTTGPSSAAAAAAAAAALSFPNESLANAGNRHSSFFDVSAHNNLKDVAKFHCNLDMDKTQRSFFVTGNLQDIQDNFDELMTYCAQDVFMTHKVYQTVLPKFRENCPHPVSFAGMVQMGSSFLTVTEKWERYLEKSVEKHKELDDMLDRKLQTLAEQAHELVDKPEKWQGDPWLSQLDWLVNPRQRKLKGSPKWYKDAYDTKAGKLKVTTRSRVAPLLLRLKWQGHPLHYLSRYGWCFKMENNNPMLDDPNNKKKPVFRDDTYSYFKVPHKDGEEANCGNPLAKNYVDAYEDKTLSSEYDAAKEALELNAKSAYWISSRERILGQFVVWDDNRSVNLNLPKDHRPTTLATTDTETKERKYGMILPQMVPMGTVTRRAVEKTWLTASNAKANRIGSELKSMIQAPDGYKIVGADVDSEELWISSVIGDAQFGFHGATALGWMTLQGTKSEGTDLHSKTAAILGISRNKAKIFNYARIYGAGVKYATSLLLQYSQGMDVETAKERALDLYSSTKGEKEHRKRNPFKRIFWHGGSESYMFNALEDIALSDDPRTPVLGCAVTDALKPKFAKDKFITSRINWVVQSSGVDYLHLLLVSMSHLIQRYDIDARFMLSVHDEVRYLSSEKDQHRTALALQVANIWTRTLFSYKLGIYNLPQSIAFFSAVDLDHVLRKEPTMTCTTPSNEEAIEVGDSCEILDTIAALEKETGLEGAKHCLLGKAKTTLGKTIPDSVVNDALDYMRSIQGQRELCDEAFLKAQMYKDYQKELEPSTDGGRETEEKVDKFMESDDMTGNEMGQESVPNQVGRSSLSSSSSSKTSKATSKKSTASRTKSTKKKSASASSSLTSGDHSLDMTFQTTTIILKPKPSMFRPSPTSFGYKSTTTSAKRPDIVIAGRKVYLDSD